MAADGVKQGGADCGLRRGGVADRCGRRGHRPLHSPQTAEAVDVELQLVLKHPVVEGLLDDVNRAGLVALDVPFGVGDGRERDDGNLLEEAVLLHVLHHLEAVHHRHEHVEEDAGVAIGMSLHVLDGLEAVCRLFDVVVAAEKHADDAAVDGGVVGDENAVFLCHKISPFRGGSPRGLRTRFRGCPFGEGRHG